MRSSVPIVMRDFIFFSLAFKIMCSFYANMLGLTFTLFKVFIFGIGYSEIRVNPIVSQGVEKQNYLFSPRIQHNGCHSFN